MPKSPVLPLEKGFTLIELMVVLVIMAVMLSAVVVSFSPNEQQRLKLMAQKTQDFMQLACDQGAMQQKMVLIEPSEQQLKAWMAQKVATSKGEAHQSLIMPQYRWQSLGEPLAWPEEVKVDWKLAKDLQSQLALQQNLELEQSVELVSDSLKAKQAYQKKMQQGWRCWPGGQWDAGQIVFRMPSSDEASQAISAWQLSWDSWGRFQLQDSQALEEEGL